MLYCNLKNFLCVYIWLYTLERFYAGVVYNINYTNYILNILFRPIRRSVCSGYKSAENLVIASWENFDERSSRKCEKEKITNVLLPFNLVQNR